MSRVPALLAAGCTALAMLWGCVARQPEHGAGRVAVGGETGAQPVLRPIPLPGPRHGHRIEHVEGGLLGFGGFGDPWAPEREMRQTWWLAPGRTRWERRADMGVPRAFFASVVVEGAVYALGEGVERYDLATDTWSGG